jgi:uncharacterized protein (TIGR02145 family)
MVMMRIFIKFIAFIPLGLCLGLVVGACDDADQFAEVRDPRDNKSYNVLIAGGKLWFAEDLKLEDSTLYSYQQGLNACPPGWSLPGKADWMDLSNYFGGYIYNGEETGDPNAGYHRMLNEFGVQEGDYYWTSSPAWDDAASIRSSMVYFNPALRAADHGAILVQSRLRCRCIKKEAPEDTGDIIQFKINAEQKTFNFFREDWPMVSGQVDLFLHRRLDKYELLDRVDFHFTLPASFVRGTDSPVVAPNARMEYQSARFPEWNWFSQSSITSKNLEVLITFYDGAVVKGKFSGISFDDVAIEDGSFELQLRK